MQAAARAWRRVAPPAFAALEPGEWRLVALRTVVVGCQAATIVITWPLWQLRDDPPLLPAAPVPQVPVGELLLATLALALLWPTGGAISHVVAVVYACVADQTRLQPEIVSMALLLVGATPLSLGRTVARAHLVSLWIWSGLNKLLSRGFAAGAPWIFEGLSIRFEPLREHFWLLVLGGEIFVGVAVALPATRKLGVVAAVVLHATILLVLSPLGRNWNQSVWPWNVALPAAAVVLFWPWETSERPARPRAPAGLARALVAAVVGVAPIGFYAGYVDAYLAHNLYTFNTPTAVVCERDGSCYNPFSLTWEALEVPFPPEPRLYIQYFERTCAPGQRLFVQPRQVRLSFGRYREPFVRRCVAAAARAATAA